MRSNEKQQGYRSHAPKLRWEVDELTLAAEAKHASNMLRAYHGRGYAIPWDVHPMSLRSSFAYNTDMLGIHRSVPLEAEHTGGVRPQRVGVTRASSRGLGDQRCGADMRPKERIGRLCHRNATERAIAIAHAIEIAEALPYAPALPPHDKFAAQMRGPANASGRAALVAAAYCWWQRTGCYFRGGARRSPMNI